MLDLQGYSKQVFNGAFSDLPMKYKGPKFDAHTHITTVKDTKGLVEVFDAFNIQGALGLSWEDAENNVHHYFAGRFIRGKFLSLKPLLKKNYHAVLNCLYELRRQQFPVVKIWFAPRWKDWIRNNYGREITLRLDSPELEPIFTCIEKLGFILIVHIADPDLLYQLNYQPPTVYGTKKQHLKEFENVIKRHSCLKFIGAHLGGQPENLDNLSRWFTMFPNFYVDMGSAKWMARAFACQKAEARKFFHQYAHRILFGSDLVAGRTVHGEIPGYYIKRLLTYQALLESPVDKLPLPFPDPENNNKTVINGLDLPVDVLGKIYWENAVNLFNLEDTVDKEPNRGKA